MKNEPEIDHYSAEDIRAQISRVLRDLDDPEPPLDLNHVRSLLKLDLNYYSSTDLNLLDEISHKLKVAGKTLVDRPTRFTDVVKKAKLNALWIPSDRCILIDDEVPELKHRHIQAHEITHSITPWHRDFLLGDNDITLKPQCHDMIEAEANYGAGQLLFLLDKFKNESRDLDLSWKSIQILKNRYKNTLTTTLWHWVEERDSTLPVVGLISRHPKHPEIGGGTDGADCTHFIRSIGFLRQFPNFDAEAIYAIVSRYVTYRPRGPVGSSTEQLTDINGDTYEFYFDSFSNSYSLLTFAFAKKKLAKSVVVL
ncbi:MAG: hypothetical protein NUV55_11040 [Sulfuricaulis sp.]|uniref:ImmA/IrrE family metallo-endopeptidase n=1 Tax=Sulfuricaulis sp. TaxID=2003553 RepID=UPI0025F19153|nr:hypothetical protein [Sulfuricaulis sp.]MCR4347719.1 hypothetical protein [Sulfuricaulis sp.]